MQEKVNKTKKQVKQNGFKYEKEHQKNPMVCRRCGKVQNKLLINGICNNCYNDYLKEASKPTNVFKVNQQEGEQFRK